MKNKKKGFSLPLAMGLVILISLLALSILEYIIPFSRDVKGVENGMKAYYQANSGIEEGLYNIYKRNNSGSIEDTNEYYNELIGVNSIDFGYKTISSGSTLPLFGEGNSEYDNNWNTISSGNPIQLSIGNGYITNSLEIAFKIPTYKDASYPTSFLDDDKIINWQLSSKNNSLNAKDNLVLGSNILKVEDNFDDNTFNLWDIEGFDLDGSKETVSSFYNTNCGASSGCTLKFSIINNLETKLRSYTSGGTTYSFEDVPHDILDPFISTSPYLEWQIQINSTKNVPLRYSKIESSGKSHGYKKYLEVKVPSNTVNEAFDFTVFQ